MRDLTWPELGQIVSITLAALALMLLVLCPTMFFWFSLFSGLIGF